MDEKRAHSVKSYFGTQVRSIRTVRGLSQVTLALMCGLDRTYIGSVERGERNISLINTYKLADALGVSPKEFME